MGENRQWGEIKFTFIQRCAWFCVSAVPKTRISCDLQVGQCLRRLHSNPPWFPGIRTYLSPLACFFPLSKSRWVITTCNYQAPLQEIRHFPQLVDLRWSGFTVTKLIVPKPMFRGRRGLHQPFVRNFSRGSERNKGLGNFSSIPHLLLPLGQFRHIQWMIFPKIKLLLYTNTNIHQTSSLVPRIVHVIFSLKRQQLAQYILTLLEYNRNYKGYFKQSLKKTKFTKTMGVTKHLSWSKYVS